MNAGRTNRAPQLVSGKAVGDIAARLAERVSASGKVVAAYDLQFEMGRRSLLDLISVRNDHYQAQVELADNRIQQIVASVRLLNILGRLTTTLVGEDAAATGEPVARGGDAPGAIPPR